MKKSIFFLTASIITILFVISGVSSATARPHHHRMHHKTHHHKMHHSHHRMHHHR